MSKNRETKKSKHIECRYHFLLRPSYFSAGSAPLGYEIGVVDVNVIHVFDLWAGLGLGGLSALGRLGLESEWWRCEEISNFLYRFSQADWVVPSWEAMSVHASLASTKRSNNCSRALVHFLP